MISNAAEPRRQCAHPHPVALAQPLVLHSGTDDQHGSCLLLVLIGEEIEHGANEVGRDPTMRHVAEKAWNARVAPDDLGPLIPLDRPRVLEEPLEHLVGAVTPAEPDE